MAGFVVKWTCCIVWECSQGLTYRQVRNVTELYGWIFKCGWRSPKPKNVGLNTGIPSFFNGHKIHFFDEWNRWRCVFFLTRIFLVLHILSMSMFLLFRQRSFIIAFWSMRFFFNTYFFGFTHFVDVDVFAFPPTIFYYTILIDVFSYGDDVW